MTTITKNLLLILAVIAMAWVGCKKDDNPNFLGDKTIQQGFVLEEGSNKPVTNATVYLLRVMSELTDPLSGYVITERIDSVKTNELGEYKLEFTHTKNGTYDMEVVADKYYKKELNTILATGFRTAFDIYITPKAWLKIHIKNVPPAMDSDYIKFAGGGGGLWSGQPIEGVDINQFQVVEVRGNIKHELFWSTNDNNNIYFKQDSVYCAAHDTTLYEINY